MMATKRNAIAGRALSLDPNRSWAPTNYRTPNGSSTLYLSQVLHVGPLRPVCSLHPPRPTCKSHQRWLHPCHPKDCFLCGSNSQLGSSSWRGADTNGDCHFQCGSQPNQLFVVHEGKRAHFLYSEPKSDPPLSHGLCMRHTPTNTYVVRWQTCKRVLWLNAMCFLKKGSSGGRVLCGVQECMTPKP